MMSDAYEVRRMPGLRTELPAGMDVTADTIVALKLLEKTGCVVLEVDDGTCVALDQLEEIAGNVGYDMVGISSHTMVLLDDRKVQTWSLAI